MPSYPFSTTIVSTPSIEVYGVNVSYEELLNSFGSYYYLIQKLFIETQTINQANQPISFTKYNVDGQKNTYVVSPTIDPYGKQAALLTDLEEYNLIADGRLVVQYNIFASTWLRFTFFTERGFLSGFLPDKSNKQQVADV